MSTCFELPAELNIYTAADTALAMQRWLSQVQSQQLTQITMDGQAVAELDAAGLQLLISLHNSCTTHALQWQLIQASQTLSAACVRLGIPTGTAA